MAHPRTWGAFWVGLVAFLWIVFVVRVSTVGFDWWSLVVPVCSAVTAVTQVFVFRDMSARARVAPLRRDG